LRWGRIMNNFIWYFKSYRQSGLSYIDSIRLALELGGQK
jgi:hypothetical protein